MAPRSTADRLWPSRQTAIWYIMFAYPGLWGSERVRKIRRLSGWARVPVYLAILLFNWSDLGSFFEYPRTRGNGSLQGLLVFAVVMNGLFPVVDVGISSALRNTHLKLCQPWQRHYPAIHGLIAAPILYMATGLLVLVLSACFPDLWPDGAKGTNGFLAPIGIVGPAVVLFMAVFQLSALFILLYHPSFGLPKGYEPIYQSKNLAPEEGSDCQHAPCGHLAVRFLGQQGKADDMPLNTADSDPTALAPPNPDGSPVAQNVRHKADQDQGGPQGMEFYSSLKSWSALSSIERIHVPNIRMLVVVATLLDTIAGWLYFGITIQLPRCPESCPSGKCVFAVVLPLMGVLIACLVTFVAYQRKRVVLRAHVLTLFGLVLVFFALSIYMSTILLKTADSEAIAEMGKGFKGILRAAGYLTAASLGLFVAVPSVWEIMQSWGIHIFGART
ncbi:hypothetical protein B0H67DRAFT_580656 [Lasiosphaeris hirsuta]|uniref:Uncharacterized protein n=1 Tax=Lasiosphaeris hirsuta TaxID=260670 RepID=A0AA40DVV5_9PEZI|nr:hypothetical protein B0H67DRAFT_580656 [Lasiosphaeris hirsuta]